MQIVIDIQEDDYRKVQDGRASVTMMRSAIRNGTPLEQEPKTGHWIKDEITERSKAAYKHKCDLCGAYYRAMYDYCPSCGAKMESEVQDEDSD